MKRKQFVEEFKEVSFCLGESFEDKYSDDKNFIWDEYSILPVKYIRKAPKQLGPTCLLFQIEIENIRVFTVEVHSKPLTDIYPLNKPEKDWLTNTDSISYKFAMSWNRTVYEELLKRNEFLKNVNNYLRLLTTKYNDQYKVFHNTDIPIPKSIGVKVIGDRNLTFNKSFIINKGFKHNIKVSNYVIDGNEIVGRVKSVYSNTADVVTVKSIDYGEEVIINGESYIVSGTNNDYLSFLRKKDSSQEYNFSKNQTAYVKNNLINLILGKIDFKNNHPIIYTKYNFNLDNLRVILDD